MSSCKPIATLVDTKTKLSTDSGPAVFDSTHHYRSLACVLQHLTFTRPDIAYDIWQVYLFMHDPHEPHYNVLKRALHSIQGITDHWLYTYILPFTCA